MNVIGEPRVEIVVQPKSHGQRFRYKCESRSAGCLIGDGSTNDNKVYPTVEIKNLNGQSAIIVVSCVTRDSPHHPHPHNLVGTGCKDGVCTIRLKPPHSTATLSGVGIQCCKRGDIAASLAKRQELRVNPFGTAPDPREKVDLSVVRLCFQAFLPDASKKFTRILPPVVTNPIIDKKTVRDLIIVRLSMHSGTVNGGDDMIILCEKVRKDDISVRFFEQSPDGDLLWEEYADQSTIEVHHQYAICFKTPAFHDTNIQQARSVFIQLYRPSTYEVGDAKPFQYQPANHDPYGVAAKRKKAQGINSSSFLPFTATSAQLLPPALNQVLDGGINGMSGAVAAANLPIFKFGLDTAAAVQNRTATAAAAVGAVRGDAAAADSSRCQRPNASMVPTYSYDNIGHVVTHNDNGSFMDDSSSSSMAVGRFIQDDCSGLPAATTHDFTHGLNFVAPKLGDNMNASTVIQGLTDAQVMAGVDVLRIDANSVLDVDQNAFSSLTIGDDALNLQSAELSGLGLEEFLRQLPSGTLQEIPSGVLNGVVDYDFNGDVQQAVRDASNTPGT